jgi:hypothetical protein
MLHRAQRLLASQEHANRLRRLRGQMMQELQVIQAAEARLVNSLTSLKEVKGHFRIRKVQQEV